MSKEQLLIKIKSYLSNGGLFNPEFMDHDMVRDLILACREYILYEADNKTNR